MNANRKTLRGGICTETEKLKKYEIGGLWFLAHLALEVICFQFYYKYFGSLTIAGLMAFVYDIAAFMPQLFIGALCDVKKKFLPGFAGVAMVLAGVLLKLLAPWKIFPFLLVSLGNAFVHVGGAKDTLDTCGSRLAPPAIFVAGGAMGVVTGKLLGLHDRSLLIGGGIMLLGTVCILLSHLIKKGMKTPAPARYDLADSRRSAVTVAALSFFVVAARGLVGYGLPTLWISSEYHTFLLFAGMAAGKALGGICSDLFGAKKTALLSVLVSMPLVYIGQHTMWLSLFAIMLFSMTMSTTLGLLVSVFPEKPVTAYGISVAGLLCGSLFVFVKPYAPWLFGGTFCAVLMGAVVMWYIMKNDEPWRRRQ